MAKRKVSEREKQRRRAIKKTIESIKRDIRSTQKALMSKHKMLSGMYHKMIVLEKRTKGGT